MYLTIASTVRSEIEVKKSKFLAVVARASTEDDARDLIAAARAANPKAGHHCSAFVLGDEPGTRIVRASDDGEPNGTAGTPMLEVLTGRDLTNVVAVVSRYFGGTELGTGGLARAYAGAVVDAMQTARLRRREKRELVRVEFGHAEVGRIESDLRSRGIDVLTVEYLSRAVLTLATQDPDALSGVLAALTSGRARPERLGSDYVEVTP